MSLQEVVRAGVAAIALTVSTGLSAAIESGGIRGVVVEKSNHQPIALANVLLEGSAIGASTDPGGSFAIKGVDEGVYKIMVTHVGHLPLLVSDVRVVRGKMTVLSLELAEDLIDVGEVSTEAGRLRDDVQATVSHYTYSREEINRSPGAAGDIFRAIETLPGVSSSGGEFSAFSVRGASPKENIVLVDNIPVDRLTHFEGGSEEQEAQGGRFSIFAPNLIQEARFQAGGFSAQYGGKNASLVDLSIKEGNPDNATVNGTYDLLGWEFNYDGPSLLHAGTSVVFSARHQNFRQILRMTGQKDLGDPSFTDLILKTTTRLDASNTISLLGIYAPERFIRTVDHVYESQDRAQTELQDLDENKTVAGVTWKLLAGHSGFLHTTGYYKQRNAAFVLGRAYTDAVNGVVPSVDTMPTRPDVLAIASHETETGIRSAFTLLEGPATINAGVELMRQRLDHAVAQNGPDTLYTFDGNDSRDPSQLFLVRTPDQVNTAFDDTRDRFAAFVEPVVTLGRLTVTPGLRYEHTSLSAQDLLSPRIGLSYMLNTSTRLSAAGGIYYQDPDLAMVALDPRNRGLEKEKAVHAIAGVTHYAGNAVKITIEGYYKDLDNLLVRVDRTSQQRENRGTGWAAGIDISIVRRFVDRLYGQVNYSFAQSRRNDNDGTGWYNADFNQPHIFNILAGYQLDDEWSFSAKWKFATGRPADSYIIHGDVFSNPAFVRFSREITGTNDRRLEDFHTLNVRVDFRKQLGRVALVSFVDILNLYSHLNVNEERFLEQTGTIDRKGFEIIPTIGVKLEI